jgi:hypothetical protein
MSSSSGHQYQHGVKKNIFNAVGGVLVGAASVLLIASLLKKREAHQAPALAGNATQAPAPDQDTDTGTNP